MIYNRKQLLILWVGLGLFVAAFIWDNVFSGDNNFKRYKKSIEKYLHAAETDADNLIKETEFIERRLGGRTYKDDLTKIEELHKKPYNFCILLDDSIVFWSKNDVLPQWSDFSDTLLNKTFVHLVMGKDSSQYELRYKNSLHKGKRLIAAALIPIKKSYNTFEGRYLDSHFPASPYISVGLELTNTKQKHYISTIDRHILCYLSGEEPFKDFAHEWGMTLLMFIGFFMIGIFGDRIAKQMLKQYDTAFIGTTFFFGIMALMRLCILWVQRSGKLQYLDNNYNGYPDAIFVTSLSELIIDTGFLFWFSIFFNKAFRLPNYQDHSILKRWSLAAAFYIVIVSLMILCIGIFNDLVSNWQDLLEFDILTDFNTQSIFAVLGLGIILLSVFLISHRLILNIIDLKLSGWQQFLAVELAAGIGVFLFHNYDFKLSEWTFLFFILAYIGFFHQFMKYKKPGLIWLVQWVLIFSAIQATFISHFNVQKDKKIKEIYAYNLSLEQDSVAESYIKILTQNIERDSIIRILTLRPVRYDVDPKRISDRIETLFNNDEYLSQQYSLRFFGHYQTGEALIQKDSLDLKSTIRQYTSGTPVDITNKIRFSKDKTGEDAYYAIAVIPVMPTNPVYVMMEFKRQDKFSSRVFSELLVEKNYKGLNNLNDYSYAIYKNGICTEYNQKGVYDTYISNADEPPGKDTFRRVKNRDEYTYRASDGIIVRIGRELPVSSQVVPLGMYIIIVMCLLLFILSVLNHFLRFLPDILNFNFALSFQTSLRNRILFPSIAFILLSYLAIFFFTVDYFRKIDEQYYNKDLESKSNTIVSNLVDKLNKSDKNNLVNNGNIDSLLVAFSESNQNAIHLFDTEGYMNATTEGKFFEKGLVSNRMNPVAYHHLRNGREKVFKTDEKIGKFHYKTAYYAIQDTTNKQPLGFLELPYYSGDRKLRIGISDIWSYNATILTLLFILGICIIYYMTSRNMAPIQQVADLVKKLSLGKKDKNDILPWDKKDEIGTLIEAYNTKVTELEDTYSKLSEAEREGAWRDMAKQVAHEIRNPLTPMKLIVQHLEMIRRQRPDNLEEYLVRSNKVLLDQIDNLEKIVSEFASFAKMPQQASNEMFVINDLVNSVGNLFSQKEDGRNIEFIINVPAERYTVYADRTLLTGALNNLVKNATQAILPEKEGRILLSLYRKNNQAIIRISDNGTGIPKDIQDKIFSPNFTTKSYGTGIGLLITKNIIQSVNGKIYFPSVENEGTDFYIELDIQDIDYPEQDENPTTDTPLSITKP